MPSFQNVSPSSKACYVKSKVSVLSFRNWIWKFSIKRQTTFGIQNSVSDWLAHTHHSHKSRVFKGCDLCRHCLFIMASSPKSLNTFLKPPTQNFMEPLRFILVGPDNELNCHKLGKGVTRVGWEGWNPTEKTQRCFQC